MKCKFTCSRIAAGNLLRIDDVAVLQVADPAEMSTFAAAVASTDGNPMRVSVLKE